MEVSSFHPLRAWLASSQTQARNPGNHQLGLKRNRSKVRLRLPPNGAVTPTFANVHFVLCLSLFSFHLNRPRSFLFSLRLRSLPAKAARRVPPTSSLPFSFVTARRGGLLRHPVVDSAASPAWQGRAEHSLFLQSPVFPVRLQFLMLLVSVFLLRFQVTYRP